MFVVFGYCCPAVDVVAGAAAVVGARCSVSGSGEKGEVLGALRTGAVARGASCWVSVCSEGRAPALGRGIGVEVRSRAFLRHWAAAAAVAAAVADAAFVASFAAAAVESFVQDASESHPWAYRRPWHNSGACSSGARQTLVRQLRRDCSDIRPGSWAL